MRPYGQGTDASALLGVRLETAKTAGRMYAAYPNLADVRWLLPAKEPSLRRAGIGGLCSGLRPHCSKEFAKIIPKPAPLRDESSPP